LIVSVRAPYKQRSPSKVFFSHLAPVTKVIKDRNGKRLATFTGLKKYLVLSVEFELCLLDQHNFYQSLAKNQCLSQRLIIYISPFAEF